MPTQSSQATLAARQSVRTGATTALIQAWLRLAVDAALVWHERARQRRRLQMLTERDLRDLGLARSEVDHEVSKPFWRP